MGSLTPEQRALGRENANRVLGVSRRDMLKAGVDLASLNVVRDVRQAVKTAKQARAGKGRP